MKKIYLSFLFICFLNTTMAQPNLLWAKQMKSVNYGSGAVSITVDINGNVYTVGDFVGTVDFDPGPAIHNLTGSSCCDNIFISKLDPNGNFLWVKGILGSGYNRSGEIACDADGNIYVTGNMMTYSGYKIFICKLDPNGNTVWTKEMRSTGSGFNKGNSISLDNNNNIFIAGYFCDTMDFNPGPGVYNVIASGYRDMFIAKYDTAGNFIWVESTGKAGCYVEATSLSLDIYNNIYVKGSFSDTVDFDPGPSTYNLIASPTARDIFITKFDGSGNFILAKCIHAEDIYFGRSMVVDTLENIFITGRFFYTVDFDPGIGVFNLTALANHSNIFICRLDKNGDLIWARQLGGTMDDRALTIAIDEKQNIYTTGLFEDTVDFNPDAGVYNLISTGFGDGYICQLDAKGYFICAGELEGTSGGGGRSISFDASGNIYVSGSFAGTIDLDPGPGTNSFTCSANCDAFIAKYSNCLFTVGEFEVLNQNPQIQIYPNPTTGLLTIQSQTPNTQLKIYNPFGQLIHQQTLNSKLQTLNLSSEAKGIYFLELTANSIREIQKIIIQ